MSSRDDVLACPSCATPHGLDERFCTRCGMPLVYVGKTAYDPPTPTRERARKIHPPYAQGELLRVAGGRNQAEAELIQNLLIEEGIPSVARRSAGFDVPDFLAAGPRDVLVAEGGAEAARDVLLKSDLAPSEPAPGPSRRLVLRLLAAIVAGGLLTAGVAWALIQALE